MNSEVRSIKLVLHLHNNSREQSKADCGGRPCWPRFPPGCKNGSLPSIRAIFQPSAPIPITWKPKATSLYPSLSESPRASSRLPSPSQVLTPPMASPTLPTEEHRGGEECPVMVTSHPDRIKNRLEDKPLSKSVKETYPRATFHRLGACLE